MGDCEVDVDSPQNIISFCTGYGGIELGLRRAGVDVRTICYNEVEAFVQANLVAKIEEGRMDNAPIWSDLKTFPASEFRGKVDGIVGGYPCQPFSSAGKRKGEKDPRHLWPYIREHVRAIRPLWCFFENVRGHTTMGLWRVLSDLEEDGYRTEFGLFSAEETGAPHQRIRVFILAYRNCEGSQGMLQDFGSQGREAERRSTARCGEHSGEELGNSPSLRPRGGRENCEGEQSEVLGERLESDGELAHPASREPRQSQARNGGQDTSGGSEEELADSDRDEQTEERGDDGEVLKVSQIKGQKHSPTLLGRGDTDTGSEEELADCDNQRCDREQVSVQPGRSQQEGDEVMRSSRATQWPARPGEEQYEWEEPRVTEAQSELGGAVDGSRSGVDPIANRVDRLRLLGNGVVSQCAEIAWKTLWKELQH